MPELTLRDIDRIRRDVKGDNICFSHLADELLDHLCCDVELEMAGGLNFFEAYRKVKGKMGQRRLKEIQEETLYAVDTKYRNMKNTMKISGIAGTTMLGFAALFKIMHWPGSQLLMIVGLAGLFFVILPWHMWLTWKDDRNVSARFIFIIVGSLAIVIPSMLLNLSIQRDFNLGFKLMLSEQQALFRYRLAENSLLLDSNSDTTRIRLLSEINHRTLDLISTIVQMEESMISEAVGEPGTPVSRASQMTKKESGDEIQLVAMIQPFNTALFSNYFLPGTQSRISLDRALKDYSGFIKQIETDTDPTNLSLLLEPESWFPDNEEPEERASLVSSLHLLELMKNTILTVENRALKAVIDN